MPSSIVMTVRRNFKEGLHFDLFTQKQWKSNISWKLNFLWFLCWQIECLDKNRKFIGSFWFLAAFICNIVMNCFFKYTLHIFIWNRASKVFKWTFWSFHCIERSYSTKFSYKYFRQLSGLTLALNLFWF